MPASMSSLGRQVASTIRSSPVAQVGTGTREAFAKRYTGPGNEPVREVAEGCVARGGRGRSLAHSHSCVCRHRPGVTQLPTDKNPGFTYSNQRSGMGKQEVSVRRTLPAFSFGATSPRKLPRNYHAVQGT